MGPPGRRLLCAGSTAGPLAFGTSVRARTRARRRQIPASPSRRRPPSLPLQPSPDGSVIISAWGKLRLPLGAVLLNNAMLPLMPGPQHRRETQKAGQGCRRPPRDRGLALFRDGETKGRGGRGPSCGRPSAHPCSLEEVPVTCHPKSWCYLWRRCNSKTWATPQMPLPPGKAECVAFRGHTDTASTCHG